MSEMPAREAILLNSLSNALAATGSNCSVAAEDVVEDPLSSKPMLSIAAISSPTARSPMATRPLVRVMLPHCCSRNHHRGVRPLSLLANNGMGALAFYRAGQESL